MGTKKNKTLTATFFCLIALGLLPQLGCSGGSSSNNNNYQCVQNGSNSPVSNSYCTSNMSGYSCQQNGTYVSNNLCANNGSSYQCYQNGNMQSPVSYQYCAQGAPGYTCAVNGQTVAETQCNGSMVNTNYPGGGSGQSCAGQGPFNWNGGMITSPFTGQTSYYPPQQNVYCQNSQPNNCSGATLVYVPTNQTVYCQ